VDSVSEPNANIAARLAERAAEHPDRTAIVESTRGRRRAITFSQLAQRAASVAAALAARGVSPGDPVLLLLPMSIELYAALLAVHHLGAVVVVVDPWAGRARLDAGIRAANPKAFIGSPRAHLFRFLSPALRAVSIKIIADRGGRGLSRLAREATPEAARSLSAETPALVTFTTGTTGRPKAAVRTHGFLWTQHEILSRHLEIAPEDVDMPTLPIFVLNNLAAGTPSVIPDFDARRPGKLNPERVHRQITGERVTTTTGSPAFYESLVRWCETRNTRLPLRLLFTGGAPVLPTLARLLVERVEGDSFVLYGSTEAEPISSIRVREMLEAMRQETAGICVGLPIPEIQLRIIRPLDGAVELGDEGWSPLECSAGEAGEIIVTGEHVLTGYLNDPESDRRNKIRDGKRIWHRTGDGARLDTRGRIWLMGRLSQRVTRSSRDWWSLPVEMWAIGQDGVRFAAYLPTPGGDGGDRAALCLEGPAEEIRSLESRKIRLTLDPIPVDDIFELDWIPRDPRHESKTDVGALRELLERRRPRED
jgi:acyl-CoA synthetase (AMP-forming)/AMP-acid ligase II